MHRHQLMLVFVAAVFLINASELFGQAGLRESLERLDTNNNGEIDPEEVTPLARPYLERVTSSRELSIGRRPVKIESIQEAARRYYLQRNGVYDRDIRPDPDSGVRSFGPEKDKPVVPAFGLAEVKYPYTQDDLDFADRTMRRCDENRDGYIDREEARDEKWTHRDPFDDDYDKDGKISRLELAQRYARRRLLDQSYDELRQKAWRGGSEIRSVERESDNGEDSRWWRRGNDYWLTAGVIERFDLNKNGRLEASEAITTGLPITQIDINRDGELSREELYAHLSELQRETGALSEGIPGWFYELDVDRDRQVSMAEFATDWSDEKLREFTALDLNGDGLLTSTEVVRSKAMVGGSYRNGDAEVIPPGRTVISEIEVSEDFPIGDLNLKLSITHTRVSDLDAYLTGPDGQRIELFSAVGGSDDHFDETVFDDQSSYPIVKARPPFKGSFQPGALVKRQPSLSHFNGQSVQGVWQLVIRATRSERFGMLHEWSLLVTPIDDMLDQPTAPESDDPSSTVDGQRPASAMSTQPRPEFPETAKLVGDGEGRGIDYQAINQRFQAAVQEGRMTEEQVREAWIKIKGGGKPSGGEDERRKMEAR